MCAVVALAGLGVGQREVDDAVGVVYDLEELRACYVGLCVGGAEYRGHVGDY